MKKRILLLFLGLLLLTNCKKDKTNLDIGNENLSHIDEIDSLKMYGFDNSNLEHKIYEIQGKNIFMRDGPGTNYKKLVNQKATDAIGETQYMQVDYTCTVTIEEEKNNWAKVRIVDPSHLSATHYGWIPLKNIITDGSPTPSVILPQLQYDIISTTENNVSKNYNIYLNTNSLSKDEISNFVKQFRENHCSTCTISIFDTKSIKKLLEKYPLNKNEYLKLADHFVAYSTFDTPKLLSFYPFQDSQYTEYGGKNYKEKKMK